MNYILTDEDMKILFSRIKEEYDTYGTVEKEGDIVYEKVDGFESITFGRSRYAPKEFLIERNENVLNLPVQQKKAVFGVMSCDLKGFYVMDKQILGKDPFYTQRRQNTLFVNFPCNVECEGGFCSSFGGPLLDEFQIQVARDGDDFIVSASKEYEHLFDGFRKTGDEQIRKLRKNFLKNAKQLPVEGIENRIKWDSKLWKKYSSICISCGACNYSCPTCYCFDLFDQDDGRIREWDSCILSGFTSTSAGNVRKELDERLRQRFYHKFVYYRKSQGEYLCTGCNRCTEDCPVDIDIKEVVTHDYSSE